MSEHEKDPELNPDGPDIPDEALGLPGPPEPLPEGDAECDEPTGVNEYDEES